MRILFPLLAATLSALPLTAQSDVVEECPPVAENGVDVTVRYRPTTPNPLAKGHGLMIAAVDRSRLCSAWVSPGGTTTIRGVPPGEYRYHMLWNGEGTYDLTVPDSSFAFAIEIPAENRIADCRSDSRCAAALLEAPAYDASVPEAFFFHLGAVLGGARSSDAELCLRAPGPALRLMRDRYSNTSVEPTCDGGHFIIVRDMERDGTSITARISSGILRPERRSYWPTSYACLIEDTGSGYVAVQCTIESMA